MCKHGASRVCQVHKVLAPGQCVMLRALQQNVHATSCSSIAWDAQHEHTAQGGEHTAKGRGTGRGQQWNGKGNWQKGGRAKKRNKGEEGKGGKGKWGGKGKRGRGGQRGGGQRERVAAGARAMGERRHLLGTACSSCWLAWILAAGSQEKDSSRPSDHPRPAPHSSVTTTSHLLIRASFLQLVCIQAQSGCHFCTDSTPKY